jgi:hypothetical protein
VGRLRPVVTAGSLSGGCQRANIQVDRSAGPGWTFAQSHMANIQIKSATESGWTFVLSHMANIQPAPETMPRWTFARRHKDPDAVQTT